MRLAIPVEGNNMETSVCISFGRTPYFLIYDTDTQKSIFLDNAAAASQGGAGIKAAQMVVDNNVNTLLTPRCGENAAEVIKGASIKMYKTNGTSVINNIKEYTEGTLPLLEETHEGFHHHGDK